jgi:hypothetical protein
MAYNPKSKRTNPKGTPQQVKNLNGLTANKNIDDIRALSKISNGHGTSIDTLNSDVKIINGEISSLQKTKQDNIKLTTTGSSGPSTLSGSKLNIPDYSLALSGFVPYTGATQDVDLGSFSLTAEYIEVNTNPAIVVNVAQMGWNSDDGTFDMGMLNGVTLQAGQEMLFYAKAAEAIADGDAVQFAGAQGSHLLIKRAVPSEINVNPEYFVGVATQTFANNDFGYVTAFGKVRNLDTLVYPEGTVLYFASSGATPGALTPTEPSAPNAKIIVAAVARSHQNQGVLFVRPHAMPKMKDIQDVDVTGATNGQVLTYNGSIWTPTTPTVGTVTAVTASAPLSSSGGTTPNISILRANTTTDGYLSAIDWNTFNNKQPAGNYITALSGEATGSGPGTASVTLNNASVTAKVLTGINVTGGSINASDSILTAFGKLQNQINGLIGSSIYQGTWNASTNTPTLTSGVGTRGYYYIVNVAGSTNLDGITDWNVGDWAIFDGTAWQQVDNTDSVTSVNGQTGAVSLTSDNIPEGVTNLYFTNLRARQALSLTTTGSSGASTYDNTTGVLNVPNYTLSGIGGVPLSRTLTINGTAYDLSADRSWNVGTVTSVDMSVPTGFTVSGNPITGAGTLSLGFNSDYSLPTIASQLEWDTAYDNMIVSASVTGTTTKTLTLNQQDGGTIVTSWTDYDTAPVTSVFGRTGAVVAQSGDYSTTLVTEGTNLYFTDARARAAISLTTLGTSGAATYNSSTGVLNIPQYQSVITNPVTGTGTANYVARWTSSSQISTGVLYDNGTNVGIGTNNPASKLTLQASNNTYALELRNSLGDTRGGFFYDNTSGTNTSLFMQSSVGTDVVVLRTSGTSYLNGGNVGIGTTNPLGPLEVYRSAPGSLGGYIVINNDGSSVFNETALMFGDGNASGIRAAISTTTENSPYYGQINFKTGAGTYASLSTRMTITGAGNVGIGTTSPSYKLHVVGTFTSTSDTILANAINSPIKNINNYPIFEGQGASAQFGFSRAGSGTVTYIGSDSTYLFRLWDGSFGANYFNVLQNGNIGIGTTSPNRKLTVAGEISSNYGSNQGALWLGEIALQNASFTSYGVLDFTMHNGGGFSDVMRIQGNGRVGIGTTSPLRKLDVSGGHDDTTAILYASGSWGTASLDMWASEPGITLEGSGIGNNVNSSPYYGRRTTAYGQSYLRFILGEITFSTGATTASEMMRIRTNGNVGIGTTNPSQKLTVDSGNIYVSQGGFIAYRTDGGTGLEVNGGDLGPGSFIARFRDYSNNDKLVINGIGNVGIGTTTPVYKLDVIGIGKFGDHALIGSGVPQGYYQDSLNGAYRGTNGSGDKGFYFQSYDGINTSAFVGIEGTYAARIGIGNSAPATALHISKGNESYTLYGPNASWGAYLWVGAGPDKISNGSAQVISTNGNLHLDSGTGQETYINSYSQTPTLINPQGGNVAVGTFNVNSYPYAAKFNVNGSISSSGGKIGFGVTDAFTLNGIDTAHYGMSSNMNLVQLSGYYGLVFATTGTERMRITDGGNLGIGTTSPLYKTTIYNGPTNTDVLCISNDQIQGGSFAQNFVGISLQDQYANGGGNVSVIRSYSNLYQQWGSALVFGTTGNTGNGVIERMVINPEGNVGINTSIFSPTEKLEVNGNINISPRSFTPGFLSFYNDLAGQPPFITNFSGVRWGYKNGDPMSGPVSATDMSIINNPLLAGYFGSIMSFRIQSQLLFTPSNADTQVDKLNLVPYSFMTGTGGVGINTTSPQASLHVYENGGLPPYYRNDFRAAKFEWDFGGVVFPNVPEDNKNMIPGEPGMVIFNTTVAKLQVFDGTNWVNLH